MAVIETTREVLDGLQDEARRAAPCEACGLLLGRGQAIDRILPARNVHPVPQTHFEIDPQALVDAHRAERGGGLRLIGYYHSHPRGAAEPSATDRAQSSGDGRIWAIVGVDGVRFWRDDETGFVELSTRLVTR